MYMCASVCLCVYLVSLCVFVSDTVKKSIIGKDTENLVLTEYLHILSDLPPLKPGISPLSI